jgi:SNW domain-containing protein 1
VQGYTIPLDKRLAADGRGLQEVTLNKKHMDMSLALAGAEDAARRETELQARLQSEMKQREKQRKEEHLRKLAASARAGAPAGARSLASRLEDEEDGNNAAGAARSYRAFNAVAVLHCGVLTMDVVGMMVRPHSVACGIHARMRTLQRKDV